MPGLSSPIRSYTLIPSLYLKLWTKIRNWIWVRYVAFLTEYKPMFFCFFLYCNLLSSKLFNSSSKSPCIQEKAFSLSLIYCKWNNAKCISQFLTFKSVIINYAMLFSFSHLIRQFFKEIKYYFENKNKIFNFRKCTFHL